MSVTDSLLANNAAYVASFDNGDLAMLRRKKVAVVACMDARLNVYGALGLGVGDAHIIRNAGGVSPTTRSAHWRSPNDFSAPRRSSSSTTPTAGCSRSPTTSSSGRSKTTSASSRSGRPRRSRISTRTCASRSPGSQTSPFLPHKEQRAWVRLRRDNGRVARGRVRRRSISRCDVAQTGGAPVTLHQKAVHRRRRRDEEVVPLEPAEHEVGGRPRGAAACRSAFRRDARQCTPSPAAAHTRPVSSRRKPSNVPFVHVGEHPPAGQPAVVHVEHADVLGAGVADVQLRLVEREGQAVGSVEVVGDDRRMIRWRGRRGRRGSRRSRSRRGGPRSRCRCRTPGR